MVPAHFVAGRAGVLGKGIVLAVLCNGGRLRGGLCLTGWLWVRFFRDGPKDTPDKPRKGFHWFCLGLVGGMSLAKTCERIFPVAKIGKAHN